MAKVAAWLALGALGCAAPAYAADSAAVPLRPIAHSALLTLEVASAPKELTLRVRPNAAAPLAVTALSVSLNGRALSAEPRADGTWRVPLKDPPAHGEARLEVVLTHDGISEVLTGQVALAGAADTAAGGVRTLLRDHKQLTWWILNIAIVLIGVLAVSRRMS